MRSNGKAINAVRPPQPNAWSSGRIELEIAGHQMIAGAVELLRVGMLVMVAARFDTTDAAFLSSDLFPLVFSTVERWPELSIHPNPMTELGQSVTHTMLQQVQTELQQWEAKRAAVDDAMADLASAEPDAGDTLQEKPPEVS